MLWLLTWFELSEVESVMPKNMKNQDLENLERDLGEFDRFGFILENISSIEIKDGIREYVFTGEPKANIKVSNLSNGIKYEITEETLADEIMFYDNGEIYADGEKVEFSGKESVELSIRPQAAGIVYMNTTDCPVGVAGDYTKDVKDLSDSNIAIKKTLQSITATGLATIIGKISWQAKIAIKAAKAIKKKVDSTNENSKYLSYEAKTYYHKKAGGDGWIGGRHVTKYVTTWYTKKNFGGKSVKKTTYRLGVSG